MRPGPRCRWSGRGPRFGGIPIDNLIHVNQEARSARPAHDNRVPEPADPYWSCGSRRGPAWKPGSRLRHRLNVLRRGVSAEFRGQPRAQTPRHISATESTSAQGRAARPNAQPTPLNTKKNRARSAIRTRRVERLLVSFLRGTNTDRDKTLACLNFRDGAPGRTRTNTSVKKPDFETGCTTVVKH
jgi:hypothetical protein